MNRGINVTTRALWEKHQVSCQHPGNSSTGANGGHLDAGATNAWVSPLTTPHTR